MDRLEDLFSSEPFFVDSDDDRQQFVQQNAQKSHDDNAETDNFKGGHFEKDLLHYFQVFVQSWLDEQVECEVYGIYD